MAAPSGPIFFGLPYTPRAPLCYGRERIRSRTAPVFISQPVFPAVLLEPSKFRGRNAVLRSVTATCRLHLWRMLMTAERSLPQTQARSLRVVVVVGGGGGVQ